MSDLLTFVLALGAGGSAAGFIVFGWQLHLMERERQIRELGRAYR